MASATDRRLRAWAQHSRGRARHRSLGRAGAAALLSPPARLHLQSAVGLFLLSRRVASWRSLIYEVRNTFGDIHPYVLPVHIWRNQRRRRAAAAGQAVLRLALHRDGDALPFPRAAAGRARQAADSGNRPRRPLLAATFNGQPSRAQHQGVAARVLRLPLRHA